MIRNDIKALSAYHVPDSAGLIKLDAMENPFPMPDALQTDWAECLASVPINRYPDADMAVLRGKIAAHAGVNTDQILLGNGSDEIIQMIIMAINPGTCVIPSPTFVMYDLISRWFKRPVASAPLAKDFSLNADQFLQVCARENAEIAFLACPNNPTGNLWSEEAIKRIAEGFNGLLVIDEAYGAFSERNHTHLLASNVMILRTFSKLGWAGLRLGYLIGEEKNIAQLNKVRMPYNINALTQAAASFLLDHFDHFEAQAATIRNERERMISALNALAGVETFPSQANFILIRVADANTVFEQLKTRGMLIKNMHGAGGLLANCLRITIGSAVENNAVLAAMDDILKGIPA
ncbi:histidinol-phosphate transaminase [Mariprofundus ferrooxydans]|nr:histidinol-phosphate transaminase [Mariprofundus ferrooxydans]MBN4076981.1 histidinol-phosphate transaminase [Mariprofundus ferrooxydans]